MFSVGALAERMKMTMVEYACRQVTMVIFAAKIQDGSMERLCFTAQYGRRLERNETAQFLKGLVELLADMCVRTCKADGRFGRSLQENSLAK